MIKIFILLFFLLIELLFAYKMSKKELIPPQVIYILGFIPASLFLLPFYKKWDINLSTDTILIILGGGLLFYIVSLLTSIFEKNHAHKKWRRIKISERIVIGKYINSELYAIKKWKLIICILFELMTIFLLFIHIRNVGGGTSLSSIFYNYRIISVETYDKIPTFTSASRVASIAIGYVSMFVLLNKIFYAKFKRSSTLLLAVSVILAILVTLMLGNRGDAIKFLIAGIAQYIVISIKLNRNRIPLKMLLKVGIGAILFLLFFQQFGRMVGRTFLSFNILDYIGIYLSAPIKNLDTYLSKGGFPFFAPVGIDRNQTLISVTNFIATKFNLLSLYHSQYTEFDYQFVGAYELGNCYTCYGAYIYDFGYSGVFLYTSVMAIITQLIYFRAKRGLQNIEKEVISIPLIVYFILFFEIFFSFFSYTFYQNVFHIGFIRTIIFMYLIKWFYLYI